MLSGVWRSRTFETITGKTIADRDDIPVRDLREPLPHTVTLILGRDDLFPYRLEYRRKSDPRAATGVVVTTASVPIMVLELYEVQLNAPIDPNRFQRQAGELPVRDRTDEYLQRHQLTRQDDL